MKFTFSLATVAIFFMCTATSFSYKSYPGTRNNSLIERTIVTDTETLSGAWELMPILASDTASGRLAHINFDTKANRFTGNTGCNTMGGSFYHDNDSLVFNSVQVFTKMDCTGYNEKAFVENFSRTNHYRIENGVLELLTGQTILSKWVRKEVKESSPKI
jgi:heat shock protein HslJ